MMLARRLLSAVTSRLADGGLWTPSNISTALWLDAADASTITLNASTVSQWSDKSGNDRHATQHATPANQPTRITDGLKFDGVNDRLGFASAIMQNTTTLLMVIEPTIESAIGSCFGQWASGVNGRLGIFCNQDCAGQAHSGRLNPFMAPCSSGGCGYDGCVAYMADFAITNSPTIVGFSVSIPGTENYKVFKNGAEQDSGTVSAIATGVPSSLGSASATSNEFPYDGNIREVVAIHAVNASDRQRIEGYLAHKWDSLLGVTTLRDALPSGHPYKTAAPTV